MSAKRPSSSWKFIKVGLPFFAIMGGSVFALNLVQDIRYEFRKQKHQQHAFNELVNYIFLAIIFFHRYYIIENGLDSKRDACQRKHFRKHHL